MSVLGIVIGGLLCVLLAPLFTLRMRPGRAVLLGAAVATVTFITGRILAHYVVGPYFGAPESPDGFAERVLPQEWLELVVYGSFVVTALAFGFLARQWRVS